MNKIQNPKKEHHHSANHDSEDNCQGCQQQRRENNMLVDFYQRLNKIETKVERIKDDVHSQRTKEIEQRKKIEKINIMLLKKPEQCLKSIKEHDSKEMGYELASALIERQIKIKMENQRLQTIIEQLQKDKLKLQEQKKQQFSLQTRTLLLKNQQKPQITSIKSKSQSRYSDVLDEVRRTNDSSYFLQKKKDKDMSSSYFLDDVNRKYWEESSTGQEETNFQSFAAVNNKEKTKLQEQKQYQGLNLWLYQFKPEEIQGTSIKSLKKPSNQRISQNKGGRYKSKF